ncbi:MAG TPA: coproporphyrinogen III oxidase [Prevotella sp.]|nr:coproporphyrinogen III oxidase [Prevotella sp.]
MTGLYIHIPFCASRCIYCGFYSTTNVDIKQRYVDTLCHEMELRRYEVKGPLSTIYVGGGTPSQLSLDQLRQIFTSITNIWGKTEGEITIECNPDDINAKFANGLASIGINRVSMGVQTFNDPQLHFLHRRHSAEEAILATQQLRAAGIHNINIDLMFGFPNESMALWEEDIWMALALNPQHISAYSLMYEKGTPLYNMLHTGKIQEIDEQLSLAMYNKLIDLLTAAGYEHYEISNFAWHNENISFRSQHNSSYWHEIPYIGLGAAAHSYNLISRSWNIADINQYIKNIQHDILPSETEELDLNTRYDDLITTALRTSEGINMAKMKEEYGTNLYDYLIEGAKKYIARHQMKMANDHLSLTRDGLFISDMIMSDLMKV